MDTNVHAMLMESLLARSGLGSMPSLDLPGLLGQLDASDPAVGLLSSFLNQRAGSVTETEDDETEIFEAEWESRIGRREQEPAEPNLAPAFERLRRQVDRLYRELEHLRARNDALASALGACHLCWGEDAECTVCRGRGHAGFFESDRATFRQLVMPALRALRNREEVDRYRSSDAATAEHRHDRSDPNRRTTR